jgi:hypothetical protein
MAVAAQISMFCHGEAGCWIGIAGDLIGLDAARLAEETFAIWRDSRAAGGTGRRPDPLPRRHDGAGAHWCPVWSDRPMACLDMGWRGPDAARLRWLLAPSLAPKPN